MIDPGIGQGIFNQFRAHALATQCIRYDGVVVVDLVVIEHIRNISRHAILVDFKALFILVVFDIIIHALILTLYGLLGWAFSG